MSSLCALSIVTAALCGIWSYLAGIAGLIGWAGFAGCTTSIRYSGILESGAGSLHS